MKFTLKEIATLINGDIVGNPEIIIKGISGIKEAKEGELTFLANPKYTFLMKTTHASAVITSKEFNEATNMSLIKTDNPSLAFAKVANIIANAETYQPKGIHPSAVISPRAKLGKNVVVGAYAIIEDEVTISDNSIIYGSCYIGHHTFIGENCLIYPHVTIREKIEIGNRVIIHSGTVIGSDGFGYVEVNGIQEKIPQIGTILIEDDVEIGANVTIDRARFDKTIIGKGTKIDNLVQIAHNVIIGENCIIVSQTGISGSTTLGKGVILAGQSGIVGHIQIGDGSVVTAQSGVTKSISPHTVVFGSPAKPIAMGKKIIAYTQRLPELYNRIKELENKLKELEARLGVTNG